LQKIAPYSSTFYFKPNGYALLKFNTRWQESPKSSRVQRTVYLRSRSPEFDSERQPVTYGSLQCHIELRSPSPVSEVTDLR